MNSYTDRRPQVYASIGWIIWRSKDLCSSDIDGENYAEGWLNTWNPSDETISLSPLVMQYYRFAQLGVEGYRSIVKRLLDIAEDLSLFLRRLDFVVVSRVDGKGLPIVVFHLSNDDTRTFDEVSLCFTYLLLLVRI
jgi:glutamate/tyrosine decarboxylase-like PLP-dependent enzyme